MISRLPWIGWGVLAVAALATGCAPDKPATQQQKSEPTAANRSSSAGPQPVVTHDARDGRLADIAPPPEPTPDASYSPPATAPSAAPSPAAPAQRVHTVVAGDTLMKISRQYYGNASGWKKIAEANPKVNPKSLKVGDQLVIPE